MMIDECETVFGFEVPFRGGTGVGSSDFRFSKSHQSTTSLPSPFGTLTGR